MSRHAFADDLLKVDDPDADADADAGSTTPRTPGEGIGLAWALVAPPVARPSAPLFGLPDARTSLSADFSGGSGIDRINGGAENDTLQGLEGDDVLNGAAGNDTLRGGIGNDTLNGGIGADTASYADATEAVMVDLVDCTADDGQGGVDTLASIENLLGGAGNDSFIGDDRNNALTGGRGDDVLAGNDGNDTLVGGIGNDRLQGGDGIDTARFTTASAGVRASLFNENASDDGHGEGRDTLLEIENLTGSRYDDVLTGDRGDNVILGGAGNDTLAGLDGVDRLDGGDGIDTVSYRAAFGVSANLTRDEAASDGNGRSDILLNIENLRGSDYEDLLRGDAAVNILAGGSGDDILEGRGGNDTLNGGAGFDIATFGLSRNAVTASLLDCTASDGQGGLDTLASLEGLVGGTGNDRLTGDARTNGLAGGAGHDTLAGGLGHDVLTGGSGRDNFVFNSRLSTSSNVDRITDFRAADDRFELDNAVFTRLLGEGALSASAFRAGASARDSTDRILYDASNGRVVYDSNGNERGGAVLFATLEPGTVVTAADFWIV